MTKIWKNPHSLVQSEYLEKVSDGERDITSEVPPLLQLCDGYSLGPPTSKNGLVGFLFACSFLDKRFHVLLKCEIMFAILFQLFNNLLLRIGEIRRPLCFRIILTYAWI